MPYKADAFVDDNFGGSLDEDSDSARLRRVSYYSSCPLALGVEWELENNFILFTLLDHLLSRDFALSKVLDEANFGDITCCFFESSVISLNLGG